MFTTYYICKSEVGIYNIHFSNFEKIEKIVVKFAFDKHI